MLLSGVISLPLNQPLDARCTHVPLALGYLQRQHGIAKRGAGEWGFLA